MRYELFASHVYCEAAGPISKMASQQEKVSVCSVLRCSDLWLQCNVSFVHGLKKTPSPVATPSWKPVPLPRSKHEK
jgi:hypothetical protein